MIDAALAGSAPFLPVRLLAHLRTEAYPIYVQHVYPPVC